MNRLRLSLTFVSTVLLGVAAATLGACVGDDPEVTRSESPGTPDAATPEADAGADAGAGDAGSTPSPVSVTLTPPLLRLLRPQALSAKLTVDRGEREGEATIAIVDLPAGVTADPATIAAGESSVDLAIRAADDAAFGGPTTFKVRVTVAGETVETTGKVVIAGTPGSPDSSFSANGVATVRLSTQTDVPAALALAPSGELYVAGAGANSNVAEAFLLRFTRAGELDATFGKGGKLQGIAGATVSTYGSMIPLPDGLLVAALTESGGDAAYDARRLGASGVLDTTFGAGGRVVLPGSTTSEPILRRRPSGGFLARTGAGIVAFDDSGVVDGSFQQVAAAARSMTVDAKGRILACSDNTTSFVLRRFLSTGAPDGTFGSSGVANIQLPTPDSNPSCRSVAVQSDGKIVLGGFTSGGASERRGVLVRALDNGVLDTTFGSSGFRFHGANAATTLFLGFDLESDDRIVVFGLASNLAFIRRYSANGAPDSAFGTLGEVSPLPLSSDHATVLVDREAGRVIVTGYAVPSSDGMRVGRYWL